MQSNMARKFDLHCHSDQSDGILSPEALVSRAKAQDVSVLALTDHDTTAGIARARVQAEKEGLEIITGIELSSQWNGRGIHIVGLNVDIQSPEIKAIVEKQTQRRQARAETIAKKLASMGIEGALEGARKHAGDAEIARPHFAAHLIEAGYCRTIQQAFNKYLGAGKPGDVKQLWPEFEEVIAPVVESGGIAVLAHPKKYNMTRTKLCAMVRDFVEAGGRAIEVVSGAQDARVTEDLAKIAQRFGLKASCGSDFHAPGSPWQELGKHSYLPSDVVPVWQHWEK